MQKLFNKGLALKLATDIEKEAKENALNGLKPALQQKIKDKAKITIDEQIDYLKAKGINFNITTEEQAKSYLADNSYYYKVTAYRLNFMKNQNGFYENVEFAYLTDLAVIDMHLRYLVLKLSLDIEHTLKSLLLNILTDDDGEDGYRIIEDYNEYVKKITIQRKGVNPKDYIHVKDKIIREVNNQRDYNYDFYIKAKDKVSIWKLVEMMSYGDLTSFINFYVRTNRHKSTQLKKASQFLSYSKNIRDSAAHNRPILLNITEINQLQRGSTTSHNTYQAQATMVLKDYVKQNDLNSKMFSRLLTNFKIHDLCSLIFLHDEYVHGKFMRKSRKEEMFKVYKRALYKKHMYQNIKDFDDIIKLFFGIIKKY